jgi:hypothetical protein
MKKLMLFMVLALLLSFPLQGGVEVDWGGLFYHYTFWWQNADFDSDVDDGDMHYYMHADIHATAHFGEDVMAHVKIGDWGNFGRHPIAGIGPLGVGTHIMHAYVSVGNLFNSGAPVTFIGGIFPVLYGDIAFDGGEDGFTGLKLNIATDMFHLDIFTLRGIESGGMMYMMDGMAGTPPPDQNVHGAWATIMIPDVDVEINGFGFMRTTGDDKPMWVGARSTGAPVEGLNYVADFAMMMGSNTMVDVTEYDYSGMYYSARASYTLEPVSFGGGYYYFGADDPTTTDNFEGYTVPTGGYFGGDATTGVIVVGSPYPNDFYKGWPGFGPAFTLRSPYGFNLVSPNLNVINGNVGYHSDVFAIRGDFFMYKLVEPLVADGPTDWGMEIAVMAHIPLNEMFMINATGGYLMPGDVFGDDADAMMAGYLWLAKGF